MVEFDNQSKGEANISILNEEGRSVHEIRNIPMNGSGRQSVPVSLPDVRKGIYYIRLQTGEAVVTKEFVVQ